MSKNFLIYGANGYTGELIARFAVERGLMPILAGRNEPALKNIAERLGLEYRIFSLDDDKALDAALNEVGSVLHCAGPFSITSRPMVEACLRNKKHYTDITGEIAVFESCAALDLKAKDAGIMIMPGVGFDVVPTDCLAAHLKGRLPSATHLTLAFYGMGKLSHGTQATMIMNIGKGGAVRKDGKITPVPAVWKAKEINFGTVTKQGVTISWGDVVTAFYTTGIPDIEVFTVIPPENIRMLKASRYIGWLLKTKLVQRYLRSNIRPGGPTDADRAKGKTLLWGRVSDNDGNSAESRLQAPEGYTITIHTALNITEKILAGHFIPGYQTPARAFGESLISEIAGVSAFEDI